MNKTSTIFENKMNKKTIKKANQSYHKYIKKFGDDTLVNYYPIIKKSSILADYLKIDTLEIVDNKSETESLDFSNSVIVGTMNMGYDFYRACIAICTCIKARGLNPIIFDISNQKITTGSKICNHRIKKFRTCSVIFNRFKLFGKLHFKRLSIKLLTSIKYNAINQKINESLIPLFNNIPKNIPFVATHTWVSQGAIHAGFENVYNTIINNYPLKINLSEGSLHIVQTPFAYFGYKKLYKMNNKEMLLLDKNSILKVGHYVDDEIVKTVEKDVIMRINRLENDKTLVFMLQIDTFIFNLRLVNKIINYLNPYINDKKVCLIINFGNHLKEMNKLCKNNPLFYNALSYIDNFESLYKLSNNLEVLGKGIITIYNSDIYEAVFSTNLLLRRVDLLITKPNILTFYPIPKLFIPHTNEFEQYNSIYSSQNGDGTCECLINDELKRMLKVMINERDILRKMNERIVEMKKEGYFDGCYRLIDAMKVD